MIHLEFHSRILWLCWPLQNGAPRIENHLSAMQPSFLDLNSTISLSLAISIKMSFTVFYNKNGVEKPIKLSFLDAFRGVPDLKSQKPKSVSFESFITAPSLSPFFARQSLRPNNISAPAAVKSINSRQAQTRRRTRRMVTHPRKTTTT